MQRIGIDVGGTNTDAVLLRNNQVADAVKATTTDDVTGGVRAALAELLRRHAAARDNLDAVMIGTTHFINAVVQRRGLTKIAAIRIGLPSGASLPPFVDWPRDLAQCVADEIVMLEGGHEFDGRPLVPFDARGMREAAARIRDRGLGAAAISSVFSPLDPACENEAAAILAETCPGIAITCSHELGRIGLLERENVTLLNAALTELAQTTSRALRAALSECGITAPLFLTQNDGTIASTEYAERFPVHSFACGATNSIRGAAFLSGIADAMVIDVGGTTTDIGSVVHGFPRPANTIVEIGGVRTAFRMPDLLSIGLGGGSLVTGNPPRIGPRSVGSRLTQEALVFGGETLTLTDIAVATGLMELGDRTRLSRLSGTLIEAALSRSQEMIAEHVDRMKTDAVPVPLIAVGGGAPIVPQRMAGISDVIYLANGAVANAVGAAIAQVSGEVDQIFRDLSREQAIAAAREAATRRAIEGGADPLTIETIEVEDLPLSYLPGNSLRVHVRVVGDIVKRR